MNATVLPRGTLKINRVWLKRKKTLESDAMNYRNRAAAVAAAARCMHSNTYKTDLSIAQTTPQSLSHIFLYWNKQKNGKCHTKTKKTHTIILDSNHEQHVKGRTTYLFNIRTNRRLEKKWQKNENSTRRMETTRARSGGWARWGTSSNEHLRGGPHLDLGRLRLKTWSKSDFSLAETTWPTYLYIYLLYLP